LVALEEFTPISGCSDSQNFPPTAVGSGSSLGSAPNSVPGASPAQLPYAARAASSAVRLRLSLRTLLLAGIVRFGALSNTPYLILRVKTLGGLGGLLTPETPENLGDL